MSVYIVAGNDWPVGRGGCTVERFKMLSLGNRSGERLDGRGVNGGPENDSDSRDVPVVPRDDWRSGYDLRTWKFLNRSGEPLAFHGRA